MTTIETNPRKLALRILTDVERGKFAEDMLEDAAEALGQATADLRLVHELVYGIIRMRLLLDTIISHFSTVKIRKLEKYMLQALRIGLYQIIFLDRVPDSAAVDEAVKLVSKDEDKRPGNFCNAVLRNFLRVYQRAPRRKAADPARSFFISDKDDGIVDRPIFPDAAQDALAHISQKFSHPPELVARWLARYDAERTIAICRADNRHPSLYVRVNGLHASLKETVGMLSDYGEDCEAVSAWVLRLKDARALRGEVFRRGLITVQDATAAEAAPLLNPRPGEAVLDMCAAPGGKTTHIAELMGNKGRVTAVDRRRDGVARIEQNCKRMGIRCVETHVGDACDYAAKHAGEFDRVMLDAPCSNTGVLSRRVEARWRFSASGLQELAAKQKALLAAAAVAVKPGGAILYSTCSIEPEENSQLISAFLAERPDFRLDEQREFLQGRDVGDGGYLARITRIHQSSKAAK